MNGWANKLSFGTPHELIDVVAPPSDDIILFGMERDEKNIREELDNMDDISRVVQERSGQTNPGFVNKRQAFSTFPLQSSSPS